MCLTSRIKLCEGGGRNNMFSWIVRKTKYKDNTYHKKPSLMDFLVEFRVAGMAPKWCCIDCYMYGWHEGPKMEQFNWKSAIFPAQWTFKQHVPWTLLKAQRAFKEHFLQKQFHGAEVGPWWHELIAALLHNSYSNLIWQLIPAPLI